MAEVWSARLMAFLLTIVVMMTSSAAAKLPRDPYGVYLLDQDSIELGIKELDSVLIVFYSPRCHSCRHVETELGKVVQIVSGKGLDIHVAKVDVSMDHRQTLGDRYQLQRLPSLKFFVAGGVANYRQGT